jgi:hypothetical protein
VGLGRSRRDFGNLRVSDQQTKRRKRGAWDSFAQRSKGDNPWAIDGQSIGDRMVIEQ